MPCGRIKKQKDQTGSYTMWAGKKHNASYVISATVMFSFLLLGPLGGLRGEAALKANEVLTAGDYVPQDNLTTESPLESWNSEILENQVFGDTSLKPYSHHFKSDSLIRFFISNLQGNYPALNSESKCTVFRLFSRWFH